MEEFLTAIEAHPLSTFIVFLMLVCIANALSPTSYHLHGNLNKEKEKEENKS